MFSFGPISLAPISALIAWFIYPSAPASRLVTPLYQSRYLTIIPIGRNGAVTSYGAIQTDPWLKG